MIRPQKPWFNWRDERAALATALDCQGGVVQVQASNNGPIMEFASVLRSELEHGKWPRPWVTVQFDPENANTRYFGEMLRQLERSLGLPASLPQSIAIGEGSKLGSGLSAESISISESFNFGSGGYEQSVANEERASRIVGSIRDRVSAEAFCLLFLDSPRFRRLDLADFGDLLWHRGLDELSVNGVLLVDLTCGMPRSDIEWPPSPRLKLALSDEYGSTAREHAIVDLTEWLLKFGYEKTFEAAEGYSRAMLDSHKGPKALYAQLSGLAARAAQV